jgi:hypothetical protein
MSTLSVDTITGQTAAGNVKMPAGHIVATYHHSIDPGSQSTTSQTLVETGLTITLTPKYQNSKFLMWASMHECYIGAANKGIGLALAKNGSRLFDTDAATLGYSSSSNNYFNVNLHGQDAPATTSSITYSVMVRSIYPPQSVAWCGDGTPSFLTVMEIAQ